MIILYLIGFYGIFCYLHDNINYNYCKVNICKNIAFNTGIYKTIYNKNPKFVYFSQTWGLNSLLFMIIN